MSKKEKIGATIITSIVFSFWIGALFAKFGFWDIITIAYTVMAALALVMIWTLDEDKFNRWMTELVDELSRRRRVWRDMRDEDDPRRITRRKNRRAFFQKHMTGILFIAVVVEGAGWIWSMVEDYNSTMHTFIFLVTIMLFTWDSTQEPGQKCDSDISKAKQD